MRIKIPKSTQVGIGGGITFVENLKKAIKKFGHEIVEDGDYDILFISGATLCDRETFEHAKQNNKHIILRVDNILEDSKNRNTGMSRMKEFAEKCDVVVYQSEWAKRMLTPICGDGMVIYNGVDTDIFYPRKEEKNWDNIRVFYSKYGRGEGKNFNVVQYFWREYCLKKREDTLVLVGRFASEYQKINHPFEFHNNEDYEYIGVVSDPEKHAEIMRSCDIALLPYSYDACSNTILEAQACGLPVIFEPTGGTPEIVKFGLKINEKKPEVTIQTALILNKVPTSKFNFDEFKEEFSLEKMGQKYHALFRLLEQGQFDLSE